MMSLANLVGSRVGAYLIMKRLGAGGVGEVFKGVDVMLKREVAIKVLRHELASDPLFLERFRHEAQIHAQLNHPNIASLHAFLHEGDTQFMVMEYVPGISLDEFVRSGGPVPAERALSIFRRALDGIEHAHQRGIVHRDIKPANIMLADNGQVKVMDFGIARALDCHEHFTRHGQVAGTAKSMSPEQIRGKEVDVRSDIYSLGIVLYTLLAGRAPFDGDNDHALMKAQLEQAPPPLHTLVANLPPKVEAAVMQALEKEPSRRFQTVAAFARALDACLGEVVSTPAPRPSPAGAQTSSRTAVNLEVQNAQRLPARRARRSLPKAGLRTGAVALALSALVTGAVLAWPHLKELQLKQLQLPQLQLDGLLAAAHSLLPTAPIQQAPAPAAVPRPASSPQSSDAAVPRTLAIVASKDRFKPGERISLLIKPSHDAYVYCYLQDETQRILRFYPNRFSQNALVSADAPLEIPGPMRFELVANSLDATETVACFASERDVIKELPVAVVGTDFAKLPVTSLDELRDTFARINAGTLAQASFRVEFK
jgi:serine/threonine-protein kinase